MINKLLIISIIMNSISLSYNYEYTHNDSIVIDSLYLDTSWIHDEKIHNLDSDSNHITLFKINF
jgi:hypothetical protein